MYEKVFLNKYGFYELKNKPFVEDMKKDFENCYFQILKEIMRTHIAKKKRNFLTIKCDKKE